jgi:4-amino-4-deoxy-L-arabinose transferase-like glycosyltransferase
MGLRTLWTRPPVWLTVLLICTLPIFLLALVPPWYRDSMVYHLTLPREYAQAGGMIRTDDNIFASFPLGYESILSMLHVLGEAPDYDPPFNPRLIGAWVSLGAALATVGLARLLGAGDRLSAVAGVVMVLTPTWMEFGASCYVEPYLVLLSTLALCCAVRMVEGEEGLGLPMALLLGLAAGVKYPGLAVLFFVLMGVLIVQLRPARSQTGEISRVLLGWFPLVATALVLAAPFYLRNVLERGNPIFPLGYELFGGEGWDSTRAWMYAETLKAYGEGRGILDTLALPVRLFTATDLQTGFQGSIGPVPLVLIGLGAWHMRTERGAAHGLVLALESPGPSSGL